VAGKILFVDDDQNLLDSYYRSLRKTHDLEIALGPRVGIEYVKTRGPYAVIVSDYSMPELNGIEFLSQVMVLNPDSVRIMLTGHADQRIAIDAVNEGNIFRFLNKPCDQEVLNKVLLSGLEQYRLVMSERELLEKTLRGSLKILSDILAMTNSEAFGMASRIRRYVVEIAQKMNLPDVWKFETAAMLSQIGCFIIPEEFFKRYISGASVSEKEMDLLSRHPSLAAELLVSIPRMQEIAEMIEYQGKNYDGSGVPADSLKGNEIPLGSRILKVAIDYAKHLSAGKSERDALTCLKTSPNRYDHDIVGFLEAVAGIEARYEIKKLNIIQLKEHMILGADILTRNKNVVLSKGTELSIPVILKLKQLTFSKQIDSGCTVIVPSS